MKKKNRVILSLVGFIAVMAFAAIIGTLGAKVERGDVQAAHIMFNPVVLLDSILPSKKAPL